MVTKVLLLWLALALCVAPVTAVSCEHGDEKCEVDASMSLMQMNLQIQANEEQELPKPVLASLHDQEELIDQQRERSLDLSRHLARVARTMPDGSTTKTFLDTFKICGQCSSFERWGEANDGGYLMCMDFLKKGSVKAVYSLGVEHHDQWSEDARKKLGVSVNQFDCTVSSSDCQGCTFFKKCVVTADGKHPVPGHEAEGWSLAEALAQSSQADAPDGSLLMKMDIEASEWAIYAEAAPASLKKFGELIVEFHMLEDETRHPEYLKAMQNILAAGFKVVHLHGNNYNDMYQTGSTIIPKVLEVTFVQGDASANGCVSDQIYDKLDAPNKPFTPELPLAHMA